MIGGGRGHRSFAMAVWNVPRMPDYWADDGTMVVCVQGRHGADWAGQRGPFFSLTDDRQHATGGKPGWAFGGKKAVMSRLDKADASSLRASRF